MNMMGTAWVLLLIYLWLNVHVFQQGFQYIIVISGREEAVLTAYFKILQIIHIFYPTPN